ncbi:MAG TPA: hypothetical protein VMO26_06470 [Vicinamibacterales bacterium]|nr:hypothetical protein [Vicinamibacterales bacterium]
MSNVVLAVATSTVIVFAVSAQPRPDFSGLWQLDVARSDGTAYGEGPGPVGISITQSSSEIQIATTTSRGTTSVSYTFATAGRPLTPGTPVARWQGSALITEAIRDIRGQSVTVQQTRRLAGDGREMIVDSVVNVQHGYSVAGAKVYGAAKDVFVRSR